MIYNKENFKQITKALNMMLEKHGELYCPCSAVRNADTICPCKNFKENGNCHCNLFEKCE